ncbi:MAG: AhpC/TSA family protein [Bryobacteraceae bacterium]|nr:AhpC/TSA family protein [Bryobacteraceae bacterium]
MTITQELAQAREHYRSRVIPTAALAVMDRETGRLQGADLLAGLPRPGMPAPDFLLPDLEGRAVSLSSLVAAGPAVLVFYRGGWCPYCNIHLRGLQKNLARIRAAGASLVAISPQLPDQSLSTSEKNELGFPVLSDVGNHVARRFGLVFSLSSELVELYRRFGHALEEVNGQTGQAELPVPASFVIGRDRRVLLAHGDIDYTQRLDPEEIVQFLEKRKS